MLEFKSWQTYSIFISSTFSDMQAERDYLKEIVLPRVEDELRKRRIKLQLVDLRWGVKTANLDTEDKREAEVLKVCLQKIRETKPFFIGLLGDRYGWVPNEVRKEDALQGLNITFAHKDKSVTELEMDFGVLENPEQLKRSFFYFREPLLWEQIPEALKAKYCDDFNPDYTPEDKANRKNRLIALKASIQDLYQVAGTPEKVKTYSATWNKDLGEVAGLEVWGEMVYNHIIADARVYDSENWDKLPKTWQEKEAALLDAFIEDHVSSFCGREELLEELKGHLLGATGDWGMVLTGESGSGKSAVFARVHRTLQAEDCLILAHSAGISPRSTAVQGLLQIWIPQLYRWLGFEGDPLEDFLKSADSRDQFTEGAEGKKRLPIEKLEEKLRELLTAAAQKTKVVLLIDALDRFEPTPRAQHLSWLPPVLPPNVHLLCTAITGTETQATGYHKALFTKSLEKFSSPDAAAMLSTIMVQQGKELPSEVVTALLGKVREGKPAASSPLWLSLVANLLLALDREDFAEIGKIEGRADLAIETHMLRMANDFPAEPGKLFLSLIKRAGKLFGQEFCPAVLNLLACSRNGLRERDLEALLEALGQDWQPLRFTQLRSWFRAHLQQQGEELLWNLAHSILRNALLEELPEDQRKSLHDSIAGYLLKLDQDDPLHCSETMYHLMQADNRAGAAGYLRSELSAAEKSGAAKLLSEAISNDSEADSNPALAWLLSLFERNDFRNEQLNTLVETYLFYIEPELAIYGNVYARIALLEALSCFYHCFEKNVSQTQFVYNAAVTFSHLGDIYLTLGNFKQAKLNFDKNLNLSDKQHKANQKDTGLQYNLAISHFNEGKLYKSMGHLDQSREEFIQCADLLHELLIDNPTSDFLKEILAATYSRLGDIAQEIGQLDQACDLFITSNQIEDELHRANPQNESVKLNLAISYEKLGNLYKGLGQLELAQKNYKEKLQLSEELYRANPQNESFIVGLATSYDEIGVNYLTMGLLEQAREYLFKRHELIKKLYSNNPTFQYDLAISYERLGELYQALGKFEHSFSCFDAENILLDELYSKSLENESLKRALTICYDKLGEFFRNIGIMDQAREYYNKELQYCEALYNSNPNSTKNMEGLAVSWLRLGNIEMSEGKKKKGIEYLKKYRDMISLLYKVTRMPKYQSWLEQSSKF